MKQFPACLISFISLFSLFSCQKESDNGGNPGADNFYLSQIVDVDSLTKDSSVIYFDYDNLKRVSLIRNWEQGFPVDSLYSFYYTGNNTLPFKSIYHPYNDEWFHFYNAQNKLIRDSLSDRSDTGHIIYNTRNYKTEEFTYSTDMIIIKTVSHWYQASNQTNGIITTTDTSRMDVSGNILFTRWNAFKETATQTYNSKPNPVAKLNIFPSLHLYSFFEADETFIQSPDLWITGYQSNQQGATLFINDSKQFNITYNANNYPVRSVISLTQGGGGPVFYWTRYYYYKSL